MHSKRKFRPYRMVKAVALAAIVTIGGTELLQDAVANGDTRSLTLHHVHSGESATVTFKRNGRYDPAALQKLNVLLQDWRRKEPTKMDPQLFDIIWEVYRDVDASQPIQVIGGYRSPATNAMLRARSRGVAQMSQHMLGKAMDFFIPGVPLARIREAGLRLQRGGVGFYPTSGSPFVHLDTGGIRHWPRMTRPELARVFPDGKTVHVPADGRPMSGYALALAQVESRGNRPGGAGAAFASAYESGKSGPKKNFLASLFGKDGGDDDEESSSASSVAASSAPAAAPSASSGGEEEAAPAAPAPAAAAPVAVASAQSVPTPAPHPLGRPSAPAEAAPAPVVVASAVPMPLSRPGSAPANAPVLAAQPAPVAQAAPAVVAAAPAPATEPAGEAPIIVAIAEPAAIASADMGAALANVPMPRTRPRDAGLPALIVRGSQQPDEPAPPSLSYASAADFVVARPAPGRAPEPAALPVGRSAARAPLPHTAEAQAQIRRLFAGPTVAADTSLSAPEMRRFAAFVAPPRVVIDGGFGRDASNGLATSRFSGAAVVAIPVVASADPRPQKKRLSMVAD
ncbi:DUF882 domain-containing protein [Bosea sp. 117]|uniref:DUF882 domain-containing protein n=1 Tax=Bosea sp. 117 TaxID=1125973 RepID=UPI0020BE101D|nr:DUF882 domain-containing protein [Bosea sp. 117]